MNRRRFVSSVLAALTGTAAGCVADADETPADSGSTTTGTETAVVTETPRPTPTETQAPTPDRTPTATRTPTDSPTPTGTQTLTDSPTPTSTPTPTRTPTDSPTTTATQTPFPREAGFIHGVVQGPSGGEIEIPIALGAYDELHLVVGDEEAVNFEVSATVSDGTGDGGVTVVFDTGAGGSDAEWLRAAEDGDSVSVGDVANPNGIETLDPASYDITLYESVEASDDVDVGAVNVTSDSM